MAAYKGQSAHTILNLYALRADTEAYTLALVQNAAATKYPTDMEKIPIYIFQEKTLQTKSHIHLIRIRLKTVSDWLAAMI